MKGLFLEIDSCFSSNYLGFRGDLLDLAVTQTPQGIVAMIKKEEVGLPDFRPGQVPGPQKISRP